MKRIPMGVEIEEGDPPVYSLQCGDILNVGDCVTNSHGYVSVKYVMDLLQRIEELERDRADLLEE